MHDILTRTSTKAPPLIPRLRALVPRRTDMTFEDALAVAERQAEELLTISGATYDPAPDDIIATIPQLAIELADSPVSSLRFWDRRRGRWVIQLSRSDDELSRRLHLAYEFKHILDAGTRHRLYRGSPTASTMCQAEQAAYHFAGCLLVPTRALSRAWWSGMRDVRQLANYFQVSTDILKVRLSQIGLIPSNAITDQFKFALARGMRREWQGVAA
ncbi:ImmA/IrrE family metallo-endopeptidase [Nocardia sp. NPDC003482]